MPSIPLRVLVSAALCTALIASSARAGELEVSPVIVDLGAGSRSGLVTVRNRSPTKARFEVRAFAWEQDDQGVMQLAPTKELVAYPTMLELGGGESRVIRVGSSAQPDARERTYRVFIEELPAGDAPASAGQIRVLTRVGIPVFFAPAERVQKGSLAFLAAGSGRASLRIQNAGTVRLRPTAITVVGLAEDGSRTFEVPLNPWYVLAGGQRIYEAELPAAECGRTRELVAKVAVDPDQLEARLLLPGGACAK
jgi:fimbrial chaperone protein